MTNRDRSTQSAGAAGLVVLAILAAAGLGIVTGLDWLLYGALIVEVSIIVFGFLALCLIAVFKPEMWR